MKNHKYLLFCFTMILLFSCQEDDHIVKTENLGANVLLKDNKISLFDNNENLKLDIIKTKAVTVNKIEVIKEDLVEDAGNKNSQGRQLYKKVEKSLGDALINGDVATFNSSKLEPFSFKNGKLKQQKEDTNAFFFEKEDDEKAEKQPAGTFNLFLRSTLSNGKVLNNPYSIKVNHAIKLKNGVERVKYKDTLTQKIFFITATKYAKIDDIVLSWKKGKLGTYADDDTFDFKPGDNKLDNKENLDSINLKNKDYIRYDLNIGDTLYYKLTAKSKTLIDSFVTSVAIVPQNMGSSNSGKLSANDKEFSLKTKESLDKKGNDRDADHNKILYLNPTSIQVSSGTKLSFVRVALPAPDLAEDYFSKGNLSTAKPDFERGTPVNSINNLIKGDLFLYKITRKDKDKKDVIHYGLLKIGDLLNPGTENEVIHFDYREGVLLGD